MENPEVWVTARSLKLFLKYYENPSRRLWLKRHLNYIEEDEVRAYRAYVSSGLLDSIHSQQLTVHPPLGSSTTFPTISVFLCG